MKVWPIDPVSAAILAALIAAVAGPCGAWLNSHLTTRRERWTFKRDIYVRLLEHFHEASCILAAWVGYPTSSRETELAKEVEEIRRAHSVGRVFLDDRAAAAIERLEATWESGDGIYQRGRTWWLDVEVRAGGRA